MTTTDTPDDDDLRYAEYVLGVLDAVARAAVEQEMAGSPQVVAAVSRWQQRLLPLAEEIGPSSPPAYVWARIRADLHLAEPAGKARPRTSWWDNLALWRWFGIGAGALAAASIALMLTTSQPVTTPPAISASYMASTLQQDNGSTGWTATMDLQHARMIVVPAGPETLAPGKSPELWLIPAGHKPISLGLIASNKPTSIALPAQLLSQLSATAVLAVSVEPAGGSPTGQPTGTILAKGAIIGT